MTRPIHLRLIVPENLVVEVLDIVDHHPGVINIAVHHSAARRPPGDVVLVDVVAEAADDVIARLSAVDLHVHGGIAIEHTELDVSYRAAATAHRMPGEASEAVLWSEVDHEMLSGAAPSVAYFTFFLLASLLAGIAVLTDSLVLVVGAMVIGPEYGPIAALAYGAWRRDGRLARRGAATFTRGALLGAAAAALLTAGIRAVGKLPDVGRAADRVTGFISRPDLFSVLVALIAGVAGILALTQSRSGLLVGVFISVTTIPAIADIGVGIALWRQQEAVGALTQLAVNVACMIAAGVATLSLQRRYLERVALRKR